VEIGVGGTSYELLVYFRENSGIEGLGIGSASADLAIIDIESNEITARKIEKSLLMAFMILITGAFRDKDYAVLICFNLLSISAISAKSVAVFVKSAVFFEGNHKHKRDEGYC
jgi:hypothetical protein